MSSCSVSSAVVRLARAFFSAFSCPRDEEKMTVSELLTARDMEYEYVWPHFSHVTSLTTDPSTVAYCFAGIKTSMECLVFQVLPKKCRSGRNRGKRESKTEKRGSLHHALQSPSRIESRRRDLNPRSP